MKTLKSLLFLGVAVFMAVPMAAQDKSKGDETADKPITITGCSSQDAGSTQFILKSGDLMPYPLEATAQQNLRAHLGHKVTITGTPMKGEGAHDDHRIHVNSLTMASAMCP